MTIKEFMGLMFGKDNHSFYLNDIVIDVVELLDLSTKLDCFEVGEFGEIRLYSYRTDIKS